MNVQQLSGLEIMDNLKEGKFPQPTMAVTIPMNLAEVGKGSVVFEAMAGDMHLNPMGGVHGGFAATVLDPATGGRCIPCSVRGKATARSI